MSEAITDSGASVKHPGGRPLKFGSVKELQETIEKYLASCWDFKRDMFGGRLIDKDSAAHTKASPAYLMVQVKPYTISGLAVALETTRETLLDYEDRAEYSDTIKKAKQMCQAYAEESLFIGKNPAGAIFNLKNNYDRWVDKHELDQNLNADVTSGGKPIADPLAVGFADYLKASSAIDTSTAPDA